MNFGSLFSGIGGIDLGLERAGMTCKWQVEIDDYCQKVLAKHWPKVKRFRDVREVGKHNLEPVDLIAGGFPCQPHSLAGQRRGAADDRNLWPEYIKIIKEMRPRWVVCENVPGIITTILDQVLFDLENAGYTAETLIVPACAFDAPHRRDRVFIVANSNGDERELSEIARKREEKIHVAWNGETWPMADANGQGFRTDMVGRGKAGNWSTEPDVGRVAHGIPDRMDRIEALGNAVVPQVVEWLGEIILSVDALQEEVE